MKTKTKRVTVDFPIDQHRLLKASAALEGVSLEEYIRRRVLIIEEENISDSELDPLVKNIIEKNKGALKRLANK